VTAPLTGQSHQAVDVTPEWLAEELAENYDNLAIAVAVTQDGTLWERVAESYPVVLRGISPRTAAAVAQSFADAEARRAYDIIDVPVVQLPSARSGRLVRIGAGR